MRFDRRVVTVTAVVLSVLPLWSSRPAAQNTGEARVRAAFLEMVDRRRVPLAPQASVVPEAGGRYAAEHFTFASEAGERVTGILLKAADSKGARPAVAVLHGTGTRKEDQLATLRSLSDRGFVAIAIDARYHGERARTRAGAEGGEYVEAMLQAYRNSRGHPYMYDTVWDTMRLVDYLETRGDVDGARIGLLGISKGGTEAYLTAAVDLRIAVVVPVIGVQGFRWALEHDAWQPRAATFQGALDGASRDAGLTSPDAALVHNFYDRVAPGIDGRFDGPMMLPLIAPRPLLVINGDSDPRTPLPAVMECVVAAERAYADMHAADRFGLYLQPGAGHVFTPTGELVALDWLTRWLAP